MCVHCSPFIYKSECVTMASWVQWTEWYQWSLDQSTKLLTRKQARKLQWLHTAWSEWWLLRPIDSLPPYSKHMVMWWPCGGRGGASDHWATHVITAVLLSVAARGDSIQACKRPTPSSLTLRGLAALHVWLLILLTLGYLNFISTS